jgi:hypothetical protein
MFGYAFLLGGGPAFLLLIVLLTKLSMNAEY